MNVTDPIADMLTRVRNASLARHTEVVLPGSRVKTEIARILVEEGRPRLLAAGLALLDRGGGGRRQGSLGLLLGVVRLGSFAYVMSEPVVLGFTTAGAILILSSQVPTMLGVSATGGALPSRCAT